MGEGDGLMKRAVVYLLAAAAILALAGCAWNLRFSPGGAPEQSAAPASETAPADTGTAPDSAPAAENAGAATPGEKGPAEKLGFQGGNIGAGGLVCAGEDGYVYYRSESDGWRLYKARPDGSDKTKLSDAVPDCINVLDGWVYYLNFRDGFSIWKTRADGTEETKLVDGYCGNLYVAESGMYFDRRDERNVPSVYRADLDGGNVTRIYPEAWLRYYYGGRVYVERDEFTAYDLAAGEETTLAAGTLVHSVAVDDSGVYYWAVDAGEYRRCDLDGSNERVLLRGGDYFNYCGGALYYMGIGENENGPCHIVCKLDLASNETTVLLEEANEFFDEEGRWLGVTFKQFQERPETIDPALFREDEQGMYFAGLNESMWYVYDCGGCLFTRPCLRESLIQKGRLDCLARLDGGVVIWD